MTNEQALKVIKQILDAAAKGGLFENMDATILAAQCYNHIQQQLTKLENPLDNANGLID